MDALLRTLVTSAQAHPHAAVLLVGLVAFAESLAFVGTVVPAAAVMFTAGALAAHGAVGLWPVLATAALGAILGDAGSYELGRRQEARLRNWPLMQRHERQLARADGFMRRHGAPSVALARFTGAVRASVPVLA